MNKKILSTAVLLLSTIIEKLTGIDFFYSLNDKLEEQLESKFNLNDWR